MTYKVTFAQYHTYIVDATDEDKAFDDAYSEFMSDMRTPIANTWYDDVDVECYDDDDDDDDDEYAD